MNDWEWHLLRIGWWWNFFFFFFWLFGWFFLNLNFKGKIFNNFVCVFVFAFGDDCRTHFFFFQCVRVCVWLLYKKKKCWSRWCLKENFDSEIKCQSFIDEDVKIFFLLHSYFQSVDIFHFSSFKQWNNRIESIYILISLLLLLLPIMWSLFIWY